MSAFTVLEAIGGPCDGTVFSRYSPRPHGYQLLEPPTGGLVIRRDAEELGGFPGYVDQPAAIVFRYSVPVIVHDSISRHWLYKSDAGEERHE